MKRPSLLKVLLLAMLLPVSLVSWGQDASASILINESFGDGIPEDWTQEHVVGSLDWVLDTQSDFPDGTREGDGARIAFRNTTGQTQGWRTKLVTPVLDLSLNKITNPILIITHAQEKMTGDFDTLTIWFKTAADGDWKELKKFDSYISFWQTDTIPLQQPGAYYQLAFEGSDNYGHGVVIDNVIVMPNPACMQPHNVQIWDLSNTSAQIFWLAGNNANGYNVKIDTVPLSREQLNAGVKASVVDEHISGSTSLFSTDKLETNTTYYFYVQAECPLDNSAWSEEFSFRTAVLRTLPFRETFDTLVTGYISRNPRWTFMSETDFLPFNNTNSDTYDLSAYSPDATVALLLAGDDYPGPIEANKYAYVASPRLVVDDLSKVQVSFYASYKSYGQMTSPYMSKIYIGGMTNTQDYNTFVKVDSVEFYNANSQREFTVSFIGHPEVAECKYVAFMSDFDASNFIAIDDVRVWIPEKCPEPANVKVMVKSSTDLWVTWNKGGADHGNVVVSKTEVSDFSSLPADAMQISTTAADDTARFTANEWTEYYVYVQNVAADGTVSGWSEAEWLRMPQSRTSPVKNVPVLFDFEDEERYLIDGTVFSEPEMVAGIQGFRNIAGSMPCVERSGIPVEKSSKNEVRVNVYNYPGHSYTVFPAIDGLAQCRVVLWAYYTSGRDYGMFEVGIMDDANDIHSFVPVDTLVLTSSWERYSVDLDSYSGNGKFLAFKALYKGTPDGNTFGFDNVRIEEIPQCIEAVNVQITPGETTAEVTWDAMAAATAWEVKASAEKIDYSELETVDQGKFLPVEVTGNKALVSGLIPGLNTYYVWVRPVCGEGTYGDWTAPIEFKSLCKAKESLPYVLDFEGYPTMDPYWEEYKEMPIPCVYFGTVTNTNGYVISPNITAYRTKQGSRSMEFDGSADFNWIAMPEMNADINDLQVSFWFAKSSGGSGPAHVRVGVMTDPLDSTTFETVGTYTSEEGYGVWTEVICPFTDYQGTGKHIAIMAHKADDSPQFFVDTIAVDAKLPCIKVSHPEALDITANTATLSWEKGDKESEWYVIVSTRTFSSEELEQIYADSYSGDGVAFSGFVDQNPYQAKDLAADTYYYFYVRSVCDKAEGVYGDWATRTGEFRTKCDAAIPGETFYDFESSGGEGAVPSCWSGNGDLVVGGDDYYHYPEAHSGSMIASIGSYSGGYLHTINISCEDIDEVQVSFWASAKTNVTERIPLEVGVLFNPNDISSYVAVDTVWLYPEFQFYTVKFDNYAGDAYGNRGKYIMFSNRDLAGAAECYIDDVSIDLKPDCAPADVVIDSIGEAGVEVKFVGGKAPYSYVVSSENIDPTQFNPDLSDIKVTSETEHLIDGLTPLTEYFLYVSSACGDGGYLWSAPIRFTTACLSVWPLPYEENFNKYNQYETSTDGLFIKVPDCWTTVFNGSTRQDFTVFNGNNRADGNCLLADMGGTDGEKEYIVLPGVDKPIEECQVEFRMQDSWWSRTAQARIVVGVVEDISNQATIDSTFVGLDTITQRSDIFTPCKVKMDNYQGEGGNIAILVYLDGDQYVYDLYLDDIVIRHTPPCPMPFDPKVKVYDDESITIEFDNSDGGSEWEVKCGVKGFDPSTASAVKFSSSVYTVTGLQPETLYDIYIRTLCPDVAEMTESSWVMISGRTSAPAVKDEDYPLEDDMSENKDDWKPTESEEIEMVNQWYIADNKEIDGRTGTMMYISEDGGTTCSYNEDENSAVIHRVMKFDVGRYTLSFNYNVTGYEDWGDPADYLRIAMMPEAYTIGFDDYGDMYLYDEYGTDYDMGPYGDDLPEDFVDLGSYYLSGGWQEGNIHIDIAPGNEGIFKVVFMWIVDGWSYPDATSPSAAIMDFSADYSPCVEPKNVRCDAVGVTTAGLSWTPMAKEEYTTYDVYVTGTTDLQTPPAADAEDAGMVLHEEFADTAASIDVLKENTPYIAFVRLKCGEGDYSPWSAPSAVFRTDCGPTEVDRLYSFEESEGHELYFEEEDYWGDWTRYSLPECFTNGHKDIALPITDGNTAPSLPYVYQGGAHTGSWSLYFGKADGAYIVMPDIEGDMSNLQLTFWMRCFKVDGQTGRVYNEVNHPLKSDRANALRIGTVTDMHDISTFEEIRLCDYPYDMVYIDWNVTMDTDPNALEYWVKFNVPLSGAKGKYITFLSDDFVEPYQNVYIDDVKIEALNTKAAPYELTVNGIQPTSAHVDLKSDVGSAWTLEVASDRSFSEDLQTVDATPAGADLTGLRPGTVYYVRAKQKGVDGAEYSHVAYFTTAYAVSFNENFDVAQAIPRDWMTMKGGVTPDMLFDGSGRITSSSDGFGWNAGNDTIPSHMRALHFNMTDDDMQSIWLVTPPISITTEGDRAQMMFDFGMTQGQSYEMPATDRVDNSKNKFAILISDDGGSTWKKENSTIWTNDPEELAEGGIYKSFKSLPQGLFHGMTYDLSKFRGKTVQIAFYNFSDENACLTFHFDDIHVNNVKDMHIVDDICEFDDYHMHGFDLLDTELDEGLNSFSREVYTTTEKPDTMFSLDLTMNRLAIESYDARVCENELPYTDDNGFSLTEGGTARRKVMQDGCYVIKEVRLTVDPIRREMFFDTICQGAEIIWNGMKLDRTGTTEFKTTSTVTGCDSIAVMNLRVTGALQGADTVTICHGETYNFGKFGDIAVSGDYLDTFQTGGCDSVVQLHLIVRPQLDTIINAIICPGERYTENDYDLNRTGTYPKTVPSPVGDCDSTVTLNLVEIVPDDIVEFETTIKETDLPFTFFTKTFDESYKPGSYTEDIEVEKEGCRGTIRLTLIVEEGVKPYVPMTEADNREMYITPNPVKVGSEVTLDIDLTDEERDGMTVNVYNAAGALVKSMTPGAGDIKVNCYFSPGIYVVRLTTGTGLNYQGKIIVQ